jgi:hypothetical protein
MNEVTEVGPARIKFKTSDGEWFNSTIAELNRAWEYGGPGILFVKGIKETGHTFFVSLDCIVCYSFIE